MIFNSPLNVCVALVVFESGSYTSGAKSFRTSSVLLMAGFAVGPLGEFYAFVGGSTVEPHRMEKVL